VPDSNGVNTAIAVSSVTGCAHSVSVPVQGMAKSVYLLHTGMGNATDNIYATVTFKYADGSAQTRYLIKGRDLSNWVFPSLSNARAGVAWHGPNESYASAGIYWSALDNPVAGKKIDSLIFTAASNESIYILFGLTLSDQLPYEKPKAESFGGPDNWAAATNMQALMEGLAGVTDSTEAFEMPVLSPRWVAANTDSVYVSARLAASGGYVSYRYRHSGKDKRISITATGSGKRIAFHAEIPRNAVSVLLNGKRIDFKQVQVEQSAYADFNFPLQGVAEVTINY
jgi:hypothetical protein